MISKVVNKKPAECTSLSELRDEIDRIDQTIVSLIGARFGYVKEVVKYKDKTPQAIEANDRRIAMMHDRRQWAADNGLCPDVVEGLFSSLVEYFIAEEKKLAL